jgi:hypothetical protein
LRLYFIASEMLKHDSWWRRVVPQNLGAHLLAQAKEVGIEQALLHRVIGASFGDVAALATPVWNIPALSGFTRHGT